MPRRGVNEGDVAVVDVAIVHGARPPRGSTRHRVRLSKQDEGRPVAWVGIAGPNGAHRSVQGTPPGLAAQHALQVVDHEGFGGAIVDAPEGSHDGLGAREQERPTQAARGVPPLRSSLGGVAGREHHEPGAAKIEAGHLVGSELPRVGLLDRAEAGHWREEQHRARERGQERTLALGGGLALELAVRGQVQDAWRDGAAKQRGLGVDGSEAGINPKQRRDVFGLARRRLERVLDARTGEGRHHERLRGDDVGRRWRAQELHRGAKLPDLVALVEQESPVAPERHERHRVERPVRQDVEPLAAAEGFAQGREELVVERLGLHVVVTGLCPVEGGAVGLGRPVERAHLAERHECRLGVPGHDERGVAPRAAGLTARRRRGHQRDQGRLGRQRATDGSLEITQRERDRARFGYGIEQRAIGVIDLARQFLDPCSPRGAPNFVVGHITKGSLMLLLQR